MPNSGKNQPILLKLKIIARSSRVQAPVCNALRFFPTLRHEYMDEEFAQHNVLYINGFVNCFEL